MESADDDVVDASTDIESLVRLLHDTQQRLHSLTSGEVDAVMGPAGQTYLLPQAQKQLLSDAQQQRRRVATQTALIDALPAHVALLDARGAIVSVNESWKAFATANQWRAEGFGLGQNYADVCDRVTGADQQDAQRMGAGIRAILNGGEEAFSLEYPCHSVARTCWFHVSVTPVRDGTDGGAVVMHVDITKRREAEAAALENERRYRNIVELLPDVVLTIRDGRITFVNPAGVALLGAVDAEQVLARPPLSLFAPEFHGVIRERIARLHAVPARVEFNEERLLTLDGRRIDVDVAASSHSFNGETVIEIVCRDMTQRKRAEAQTRRTAELLGAVMDSTPDFVFVRNCEGRYLLCNKAVAQGIGRPPEEIIGQTVGSVFGADCAVVIDANDRRIIASGRGETLEEVARLPNGLRTFMSTKAPYRDESGAVLGIVGIARDITERKAAETERENERALLRTLIDALPDVIYTKDAEGRFVIGNRAALSLYGAADEDDLTGKTIVELLGSAYGDLLHDNDLKVLDGRDEIEREEQTTDESGSLQWFITTKVSLRNAAGGVVGLVSISRNITDRKRAEESSRQLGERLSSTLENLSDPFGIVDFDWRLLYANRKAEEMLGMPRSALLGRVLWDSVPTLLDSAFGEAMQRARETNAAVEVIDHFSLLRKWFEMRIHPTADGMALYVRDVTAARALTARLDAEHASLIEAQRVARMGSWEIDLKAHTAIVSEEMHRILQTDPGVGALRRRHLIALVDPDDRAGVDAAFRRSMSSNETQFHEHRLLLRDGTTRVVEDRWRVSHDRHGMPVRALGTTQDITDRRAAENTLRRSQVRLDIAGEMAQVGGWSIDVASMAVEWSPVIHAIHEQPLDYVPSVERGLQYYEPADAAAMRVAVAACIERGEPFDREVEIATHHGRRRSIRVIGRAERDGQQRVVRIDGALQDITVQKRAEQALRELAERLRTTLESITDGFFTLDQEFRFDYVNRRAEQLLGLERDALIGRGVWNVFPEAVGGLSQRRYEHAMRAQVAVEVEDYYARRRLWFESNIYPSQQGLAVYFRDVTVRRRERERMQLLEACIERLNDIVMITEATFDDGSPTIMFVNDAFVRATGYSREEAVGRKPRMLHGPLTDRAVLAQVRESLERREVARAELLNYTKSGKPFWVDLVVVPVAGKGDAPSHFVAVERDITERKRDQDALRELNAELEARVAARTIEANLARQVAEKANEAKSAFLATMSHEIRTPMNGVIGMIDVLQQTSLKGHQVEMVDLIRDSAFVLLQIIEDILDFSKIEAGKLTIEEEPFQLADTVEKLCAMLDHIAVKLGVRMTVFIDPAIPQMVSGDETRVRQILVNLAGNAIKFCSGRPVQGEVSVRAELVDLRDHVAEVALVVTDNGIGIGRAAQERLFMPFSQADASTTRRFGGTGLGLAICRMLVSLMDGDISLRSAPDEGATFTVRLRFPEISAIGSHGDETGATLVSGVRCVVVGSEQAIGDNLAAYLTAAGAVVERCAGLESMQTTDDGPVVWLVLPGPTPYTGTELRALARQNAPNASVRFVVLGRGRRRRPRVEGGDLISLDADLLLRKTLFRAVAIVSGRLQQEFDRDETSVEPDATRVPLRFDAIRQRRLILVAEDNETNRKVIQRQLQLIGFMAEMVVNGMEALTRWRSGDFALLLTDLHMPEMDGYALTAAIRTEELERGLPRTPIVVLTANALRDEELRCLAAGMDAYLTKPVRLVLLKQTIDHWLVEPLASAADGSSVPAYDGSGPMDLRVLADLVGDDADIIDEVLLAFRRSAQQSSDELRDGLVRGSMQVVAEASHKLKSAARSVGAGRLGELCAAIEDAAQGARRNTVGELSERIERELGAVNDFLDAR